jgi:aspartate aminotransferase
MKIAERMTQIAPSVTMTIDAKAKRLKEEGKDILNFGVGEPDFRTPEAVCEAAIQAIRDGHHKYTPAAGTLELRKAVAEHFRDEYGVSYEAGQVVISCGAKHSLHNAFLAIVDPGDEVLIPTPYWVTYPEQVKMAGGVPVYVDCPESTEFKLTPEAVRERITPKTRVLILNSPSNPTGAVVDRKTLEGIAELACRHDLWVVSDEIYSKLVYGAPHVCFPALSKEVCERTILVNGSSKSYAMTGWRIGYAAGPAKVMKAIADFQSHSTSNPTSISQKAALAALKMPPAEVQKMVEAFRKRRDLMVDLIREVPGVKCLKPEGAFYVFPNVKGTLKPGRKDSMELADYLLDKAGIAITPGIAFGAEGYLRFSYAASEETIRKGVQRFREALAS